MPKKYTKQLKSFQKQKPYKKLLRKQALQCLGKEKLLLNKNKKHLQTLKQPGNKNYYDTLQDQLFNTRKDFFRLKKKGGATHESKEMASKGICQEIDQLKEHLRGLLYKEGEYSEMREMIKQNKKVKKGIANLQDLVGDL